MNTNSIVMWEILPNNADWDCFKTLILREILKIQNPLLEEHGAFFGSHTFVPISWMCKKQTAVSHRSTESEIVSLDTGLRLDGLSALENMGSNCFCLWKCFSCFRWHGGANEKLPFSENLSITSWFYGQRTKLACIA